MPRVTIRELGQHIQKVTHTFDYDFTGFQKKKMF